MSALGQKQTLQHVRPMSALPPKADIGTQSGNVRFVPKADIERSIRLPRRCAKVRIAGRAIPSDFAVLRGSNSGSLSDIHRDPPSSLVSGFAAEIDLAGVARIRAQKQKAMVDPITSAIITVFHKTIVRLRPQLHE